jgi:hypothetical protein
MDTGVLWPGAIAAIGGVGLLRWSWGRKQRSVPANAAGWVLLLAACTLGGLAAGAWGVTVVSLVAMALAALLLAFAAATAPASRSRPVDRRVRMLPEAGESLRLGGRLLTFALVILAGLAASLAFAIALRSAALGLGWSQANANATALIAVPLIWGVLATILLMLESRRSQLILLAATSLPLVPALLAGS